MPDAEFDPNASLPPRSIPTAVGDVARRVAGLAILPRAGLVRLRNREQRPATSGSTTRARRIRRGRRNIDDAEDVLVMEYMPKRDLGTWLDRLARENSTGDPSQRIRPPEKVLWSIFQCLWRGCIAMAWPEAQAIASGLDRTRSQIPLATESLPPVGNRDRRPRNPLVHFNLNPKSGKLRFGIFGQRISPEPCL